MFRSGSHRICYEATQIIIFGWTFVRFNDFGVDGGPAANELAPKLHLAKSHLSSRLGVTLPSVEVSY